MKCKLLVLVLFIWCLLIFIIIIVRGYSRDYHYQDQIFTNLNSGDSLSCDPCMVGFSSHDITPVFWEKWNDRNQNGVYEPGKNENFIDSNHNGVFDAIYCAGNDPGKPVSSIKTRLELSVCILQVREIRLGIVNYDGYGVNTEYYTQISNYLKRNHHIDLVLMIPNSNYHSPDLIGFWSKDVYGRPQINQQYWNEFKAKLYAAVDEACNTLTEFQFRVTRSPNQDDAVLFFNLQGSILGQIVFSHGSTDIMDRQAYISSAWYGVQRKKAYQSGIPHVMFLNQSTWDSKTNALSSTIDWVFDTVNYQPVQTNFEVFCNIRSLLIPVDLSEVLSYFIRGSTRRTIYHFSALHSQVVLLKIWKKNILGLPVKLSQRRMNHITQLFENKENTLFLPYVNDYLGDYPGELISNRYIGTMIEKNFWDMEQNYIIIGLNN